MECVCNIILNKIDNKFTTVTIPCLYCEIQDNFLMCFNTHNEMIARFNYFEIIGFYIVEN